MTTKTQLQQKIAELQAQSNPWDGHTALPWIVRGNEIYTAALGAGGRKVANCMTYDATHAQREGNAAYIVEACNAYPELKRRADMADGLAKQLRYSNNIFEAIQPEFKRIASDSVRNILTDAVKENRAALAKYWGKS